MKASRYTSKEINPPFFSDDIITVLKGNNTLWEGNIEERWFPTMYLQYISAVSNTDHKCLEVIISFPVYTEAKD